MWVGFKQFFRTTHSELRDKTDMTVQDEGMHHVNIVCSVVAGLQEVLKQEPALVEAPAIIQDPKVTHVENAVQDNQQNLASQLQKIQAMMQAIQLQYEPPQTTYQAYG